MSDNDSRIQKKIKVSSPIHKIIALCSDTAFALFSKIVEQEDKQPFLEEVKKINVHCDPDSKSLNQEQHLAAFNWHKTLLHLMNTIHTHSNDSTQHAKALDSLTTTAAPLDWTYSDLNRLSKTFFNKDLLPTYTSKTPSLDTLKTPLNHLTQQQNDEILISISQALFSKYKPPFDALLKYPLYLDSEAISPYGIQLLKALHDSFFPQVREPRVSVQWTSVVGRLLNLQVHPRILDALIPIGITGEALDLELDKITHPSIKKAIQVFVDTIRKKIDAAEGSAIQDWTRVEARISESIPSLLDSGTLPSEKTDKLTQIIESYCTELEDTCATGVGLRTIQYVLDIKNLASGTTDTLSQGDKWRDCLNQDIPKHLQAVMRNTLNLNEYSENVHHILLVAKLMYEQKGLDVPPYFQDAFLGEIDDIIREKVSTFLDSFTPPSWVLSNLSQFYQSLKQTQTSIADAISELGHSIEYTTTTTPITQHQSHFLRKLSPESCEQFLSDPSIERTAIHKTLGGHGLFGIAADIGSTHTDTTLKPTIDRLSPDAEGLTLFEHTIRGGNISLAQGEKDFFGDDDTFHSFLDAHPNMLILSVQSGSLEMIQYVLDLCPTAVLKKRMIDTQDVAERTALRRAIYEENPDIITLLIENGSNPNETLQDISLIELAGRNSQYAILDELFLRTDVSQEDKNKTILLLARHRPDFFHRLLSSKLKDNTIDILNTASPDGLYVYQVLAEFNPHALQNILEKSKDPIALFKMENKEGLSMAQSLVLENPFVLKRLLEGPLHVYAVEVFNLSTKKDAIPTIHCLAQRDLDILVVILKGPLKKYGAAILTIQNDKEEHVSHCLAKYSPIRLADLIENALTDQAIPILKTLNKTGYSVAHYLGLKQPDLLHHLLEGALKSYAVEILKIVNGKGEPLSTYLATINPSLSKHIQALLPRKPNFKIVKKPSPIPGQAARN